MGRMQDDKPDSRIPGRPRHPKPPFVGVGGKVEDRIDEAQDPWLIMEEGFREVRSSSWYSSLTLG